VRLYRGDPVRAGEVAEWGDMGLSGGPTRDPVYQMEMGGPMRGRWWTSSLFTANQYAGGGPVSFVDVPRSIADYYHGQRVATWRRRGDKVLIPEDEYLLPPEYTVGRREVDAINRGEAMVPGAAPIRCSSSSRVRHSSRRRRARRRPRRRSSRSGAGGGRLAGMVHRQHQGHAAQVMIVNIKIYYFPFYTAGSRLPSPTRAAGIDPGVRLLAPRERRLTCPPPVHRVPRNPIGFLVTYVPRGTANPRVSRTGAACV